MGLTLWVTMEVFYKADPEKYRDFDDIKAIAVCRNCGKSLLKQSHDSYWWALKNKVSGYVCTGGDGHHKPYTKNDVLKDYFNG